MGKLTLAEIERAKKWRENEIKWSKKWRDENKDFIKMTEEFEKKPIEEKRTYIAKIQKEYDSLPDMSSEKDDFFKKNVYFLRYPS